MERRREPRTAPAQLATVMVLGEGQPWMKATIVDESRRGMGLRLPAPVPPGSPVKIECGDQLILGEITHCSTAGGRYHAGLIVKHRLPGLADLHRLNRALREHQQQPQDEPAALIMGR